MSVYNYQNESQKNAVKARPTSRIREIQNYRVSGSVAIAQVVNNYGVQTIQDLKEALKKESLKDNEDRLSELQGVNFTHLTVITNTPYDITGRVGDGFGKTERARNLDKNPLQSQLVKDYKEGKIKPEI